MVASAPIAKTRAAPQIMPRQESRWKENPVLAGAPHALWPWLTDPASLTARIVARSTRFEVRVLRETRALPGRDERDLVALTAGRHAWTREVLLVADDTPVVFAHSILAPHDLTGAWHMARAIGCRPLGAALFADPGIRRGPLHSARLPAPHPLHRRAEAALDRRLPTLWARRSCFHRLGRPLLVTEVFLPDILYLGEARR
jgi:chorismate--pyruvate lyase